MAARSEPSSRVASLAKYSHHMRCGAPRRGGGPSWACARFRSGRAWSVRSEPAAAFEQLVEQDADDEHQAEREGVAQEPAKLRHLVEVHAVDGADQGGGEQDRRPGGDPLDLLVLGVA